MLHLCALGRVTDIIQPPHNNHTTIKGQYLWTDWCKHHILLCGKQISSYLITCTPDRDSWEANLNIYAISPHRDQWSISDSHSVCSCLSVRDVACSSWNKVFLCSTQWLTEAKLSGQSWGKNDISSTSGFCGMLTFLKTSNTDRELWKMKESAR